MRTYLEIWKLFTRANSEGTHYPAWLRREYEAAETKRRAEERD